METRMRKFGFRVVLARLSQASEGLAHALFEAGCTDTSVGSRNGVVSIRFFRESHSLEMAILEARDQVEMAGYDIERIELDTLNLNAMTSEWVAIVAPQQWR